MPYTYDITCSVCQYFQEDFRVGRSGWAYRFPDGTIRRVLAKPAWCERCERVISAEDVPSLDDLKERATNFPYFTNNLDWLLSWRSSRQSPGKCLICGSERITLAKEVSRREQTMPHPRCGGKLSMLNSGHVHSAWAPVTYELYSPEGESLGVQVELESPP